LVGLLIACAGRLVAQTTTTPAAAPPTVTITPTATAGPSNAAGPSSHGCEHEVTAPVLINRVEPEYPEDARKGGLEGRVVLEAIIAKDGSVEDARVLKSATYSLDQFAIKALHQWRYKPALCGDRPVRVYLTVTVTFSLNRGNKK
jgi:TonB family protein